MIIDSHCHLSYKNNIENINELISKAKHVGVTKFLNISTNVNEFETIINISDKYDDVYYTLGIHPHEAAQTNDEVFDKIKNQLNDPKLLAIGETGLDFYYNHSDKKTQILSLEKHIEVSQETNLPLVIHMRDAEKEMENIFENKFKSKKFKAVIHCFTGTNKFAQKMLEMGFYISASGIITFKNSSDLRSTFKKIPLNRLLVETDSPFLAPEPKRGKTNNPSFIVHTIEKLSEILEVSFDEICYHSTNNFSKLFNKAKIDK